MMRTIKQILMDRDNMTAKEADEAIYHAKMELQERIFDPDTCGDPFEICADHFGLEPDYIMDLMD